MTLSLEQIAEEWRALIGAPRRSAGGFSLPPWVTSEMVRGLSSYDAPAMRVRVSEALAPRIASRRSVSEADFPAWWAAHWKAQGYGVVPEHEPDSIPGALEAARQRMDALTGDRA